MDARQELLDNLTVRQIDKDAFAVERNDNPNSYHIVVILEGKGRCACAYSIFNNWDCIHITAAKQFINSKPTFKEGDNVLIKGDSKKEICTICSIDQRFKPFRYRLANSDGVAGRNEWFENQLELYDAE
jgi:hypothetical protein